jgi:hypothetical protein
MTRGRIPSITPKDKGDDAPSTSPDAEPGGGGTDPSPSDDDDLPSQSHGKLRKPRKVAAARAGKSSTHKADQSKLESDSQPVGLFDALEGEDLGDGSKAPPRGEDDFHDLHSHDELYTAFPRTEVQVAYSALKTWARELPMAHRIAAVATPVVVCLVIIIFGLAISGPDTFYLMGGHTLLPVPSTDARFPSIGSVERNEQVTVLEVTDKFALIRDPEGRTGYVQKSYLVEDTPRVTEELPFTLCHRRYVESNALPCEGRAHFQREACLASCEQKANPVPCQVSCRTRHSQCLETCGMLLSEIAAKTAKEAEQASAEMQVDEAEANAEAEPESHSESEPTSESEIVNMDERQKAGKRRSKKKRKKRKRRKRR